MKWAIVKSNMSNSNLLLCEVKMWTKLLHFTVGYFLIELLVGIFQHWRLEHKSISFIWEETGMSQKSTEFTEASVVWSLFIFYAAIESSFEVFAPLICLDFTIFKATVHWSACSDVSSLITLSGIQHSLRAGSFRIRSSWKCFILLTI